LWVHYKGREKDTEKKKNKTIAVAKFENALLSTISKEKEGKERKR
jgi:hypothetical protein